MMIEENSMCQDGNQHDNGLGQDWKRLVLKWPQNADGVVGLWPVASKKVSRKPGGGKKGSNDNGGNGEA